MFRTRLDCDLTLEFFRHLLALPFSFFEQHPIGDLVMRLSSNYAVRDLLSERILGVLLEGFMVVVLAAAMFVVNPWLGLLTVGTGVLRLAALGAIRRRQRDLMQQSLEAQSRTQSCAVETLHGILGIKAEGTEERAFQRWNVRFLEQLRITVALGRVQVSADAVLAALAVAGPAVLLLSSALLVMAEQLSLGGLVGFAALAAAFSSPLQSLGGTWSAWEMAGTHVERLAEVLETEREGTGEQSPRIVRGGITFEEVSFRYGPRAPLVLNALSFRIEAGGYVAVVGPSGSGKSTLGKMLLALYLPEVGRVLVDDTDLRELNLKDFRMQVGSVMQEAVLASGPVREYIASGRPVSDEDLCWAAQMAEIHEDILAMPLGYHTMIAENGANFSGGQRQRLAIARAVLRRPAILLFDEATSALDANTEERVFNNLYHLGCTRLLMSHRYSTISRASHVLVLNKGVLEEAGPPLDLLRRGGLYAQLFHSAAQGSSLPAERVQK